MISTGNNDRIFTGALRLLALVALGIAQPALAQEEPLSLEAPEIATNLAPEGMTNPANSSRRDATYADALRAAGPDGIIVFCYGPDWNRRSVRMLKSFWERPEIEQVTGSARLLAVPYYQNPTDEQKEKAKEISAGMPQPPFGVCPSVLMLNNEGKMYACLPGLDYLGDEMGKLGLENVSKKLAALRKMRELLAKADEVMGPTKAKILGEIADLPIKVPEDLAQQAQEADPKDTTGVVARTSHKPQALLYNLMGTKDGFLTASSNPDLKEMLTESMKVIRNENIRTADRQEAYFLLIGQTRREEGASARFKQLINACIKLDPNSPEASVARSLLEEWGSYKAPKHDKKKKDKKDKKDKKR